MVRTYSTDAPEIEALLDELDAQSGPLAIAVSGQIRGVLLGPAEYERYREYIWERGWAAVDEIRRLNADKDPDEVYELVTQIVEEVRQERYDERNRIP